MSNVINNKISLYQNIYDKHSSVYTIKQILDLVKLEKFKAEINHIKNETEKTKRDELKKKLPAVTISGLFDGNRKKENVKIHSGLIQIDLDNLADIYRTKNTLVNDIYSFAIFESPSGKGLKILIKIPPIIHLHEKHFLELEKYFFINYQLKIDKSCKDISRLMFLCCDKNIVINENSNEYLLDTLVKDEILFCEAIFKIDKNNVFKDGQRNTYIFKLACECRRLGLKENICAIYCKQFFSKTDFLENEIDKTVNSAYSNIDSFKNVVQDETDKERQSLLQIRTGRECLEDAKNKPIPKMLFGEFWHEGEISILFADTNVCKSILAVQIANSISMGVAINGFKLEAIKQSIIYFDFELSDKQFQNRYSLNYECNYPFDNNFIRSDVNTNFTDYNNFEAELFFALENAIQARQCKIIIVDNITFLKTQSTETAKDALPLMRKLIELKKRFSLSMLILAHTPKRNLSNPITINDLAGSKHLSNFADSIFSIGASNNDTQKRYLKQIKARATEKKYDSDNVIICKIHKPLNFLGFHFLGYGEEREHLKQFTDSDKVELEQKIIQFKGNNPNLSYREIANSLNTNHMKVKRVIEKYL